MLEKACQTINYVASTALESVPNSVKTFICTALFLVSSPNNALADQAFIKSLLTGNGFSAEVWMHGSSLRMVTVKHALKPKLINQLIADGALVSEQKPLVFIRSVDGQRAETKDPLMLIEIPQESLERVVRYLDINIHEDSMDFNAIYMHPLPEKLDINNLHLRSPEGRIQRGREIFGKGPGRSGGTLGYGSQALGQWNGTMSMPNGSTIAVFTTTRIDMDGEQKSVTYGIAPDGTLVPGLNFNF